MTLGGTAQVAAADCPNQRTLDPAVCSQTDPPNVMFVKKVSIFRQWQLIIYRVSNGRCLSMKTAYIVNCWQVLRRLIEHGYSSKNHVSSWRHRDDVSRDTQKVTWWHPASLRPLQSRLNQPRRMSSPEYNSTPPSPYTSRSVHDYDTSRSNRALKFKFNAKLCDDMKVRCQLLHQFMTYFFSLSLQ